MTSRTTATRARARFVGAAAAVVAVVAVVAAGALVSGALLTGSVLTASVADAAPAPGMYAATSGREYVALGDSYSAGLGLTPLTGLPTPECGQSSANFPHRVATAYDLELTDVTCSGAETGDITASRQFGSIAPQIAALSAGTDVVTVSVGGNDLGFSDIVQSCLAQSADGPLLADDSAPNCAGSYTAQGDSLSATIASAVSTSLAETYAAIAAAAPNAKVFVVGYPSLFPVAVPSAGCFTAIDSAATTFPFTTADTAYLHSVEAALDAAIQNAAIDAGFTYVPSFASSAGHDACVTDGHAYVNGVRLGEGGLDASTLHPTALGATFLAESVGTALDSAFPPALDVPPPHARANTGLNEGLVAGGIALIVLLLAGGVFVMVKRRKHA